MKTLQQHIEEKLIINKEYKKYGVTDEKLNDMSKYILKMFGCINEGSPDSNDTYSYDIKMEDDEYNKMIAVITNFIDEIEICSDKINLLQFIIQGTVGKSRRQTEIPYDLFHTYKRVQLFGCNTDRKKIYDEDKKDPNSLKLFTHESRDKYTIILWWGEDIERGCVIYKYIFCK